jgi:hypothetical protein
MGEPAIQRVKVYRLNDEGLWDDKGTGHVSVEVMEVRSGHSNRSLKCRSRGSAADSPATCLWQLPPSPPTWCCRPPALLMHSVAPMLLLAWCSAPKVSLLCGCRAAAMWGL